MKTTLMILTFALTLGISCSEKALDKVEREACETVNGKLECAADEMKDDIQDTTEELGDKVEDMTDS